MTNTKMKGNECETSMDFGGSDENGLYQSFDSLLVIVGLLIALFIICIWNKWLNVLKILNLMIFQGTMTIIISQSIISKNFNNLPYPMHW